MDPTSRNAALARVTLSAAGIEPQLVDVLARHAVVTLADLCDSTSEKLLAMEGVNEARLLRLRKMLHHHGLGLTDDPRPGTPAWDALGLEEELEPNYPWSH